MVLPFNTLEVKLPALSVLMLYPSSSLVALASFVNIRGWGSSVARTFPDGRAAHPEEQNEEENEENLKKNERKYRKMRKD